MRKLLPTTALLIAALVIMPMLSVGAGLFTASTSDTWSHLYDTVLSEYIANSLWLCLSVGLGVALLGSGSAYLVALHDFPGRRQFEWLLLLPLAMPAYVMAYVYTDFLQFVGPVQSALREWFGWRAGDYWFPDIRTLPGAALMFIFALYPYVYLLARTAFLERASGMVDAARILGLSPWQAFWHVTLPLSRPAVFAGVLLALMETLADYGTVAYFAVPTFTTGIYRAWFSLGDRTAAAQLAACLLAFVLLLLLIERYTRRRARYHDTAQRRQAQRPRLHGLPALLAIVGCLIPLTLGFLLPAMLLFQLALAEGDAQFGSRYWLLARNSFTLAAISALLAALIAILLAYAAREARSPWSKIATRLVGLGYAVPGSVIAVGVLIPVTRLDHWLAAWWQQLGHAHPGLLLTGGIAALIYAYLARFLSIALQSIEAGMSKITPSMDMAAQSLGCGPGATLRRVHLPLLSSSALAAALLVFVDVMKELPATLVMRPFNFDTLATQTWTLAADERLAEASTAALAIVAVGLLPIALLAHQIARGRQSVVC